MSISRFVQGVDRQHQTWILECRDTYAAEVNPLASE